MRKLTIGTLFAVVSMVVAVLAMAYGTQPAIAQTCEPVQYMTVDGRLRSGHVDLIITNVSNQPRGPYSAQVWITPTYEISETFTVPQLAPHVQYTRDYTAPLFLESHGYFHWNYAGCPVWPALLYRVWMNAYRSYVNQPDDDSANAWLASIIQTDQLGAGYGE